MLDYHWPNEVEVHKLFFKYFYNGFTSATKRNELLTISDYLVHFPFFDGDCISQFSVCVWRTVIGYLLVFKTFFFWPCWFPHFLISWISMTHMLFSVLSTTFSIANMKSIKYVYQVIQLYWKCCSYCRLSLYVSWVEAVKGWVCVVWNTVYIFVILVLM